MVPITIEPGPGEGLSLAGTLDGAEAPEVAGRIAAQLPAAGDARIDVSNLDVLDAGALQVLLDIAKGLEPGRRVFLVQPSEPLRMALEESGILDSGKFVVLALPFIWLG